MARIDWNIEVTGDEGSMQVRGPGVPAPPVAVEATLTRRPAEG